MRGKKVLMNEGKKLLIMKEICPAARYFTYFLNYMSSNKYIMWQILKCGRQNAKV